VTPLQLDLTAYPALHLINTWDWATETAAEAYKTTLGDPIVDQNSPIPQIISSQ
jgi:hypothetical protein